ncbi:MAG: YitT family protein [Pseudomonas sp.]|uniref:YitT family protein n=1 Tax=Pseudomonas abieticivorans TaxID=2931382 RepID=UPI0020BF7FB4|nr:YitT family protein [Pseudomonas sp. PIA16]MDE1165295.1 YitT family protein [Pseudomonas sp.]
MTTLTTRANTRHSALEDILALLIGTLLVAFGLLFLRQAGIMTGGTAGIALLIHYAYDLPFGAVFFALNLPFYWLAWRRMGWRFCVKTFCAVGLVSFFSDYQGLLINVQSIQPFYAALIGCVILGVGFIVLFRHQASLGGINILALFIQEKFGIKAGWLQMGVDIVILLTSLSLMTLPLLIASVLGAVVLNLIIALNHRSDRYSA